MTLPTSGKTVRWSASDPQVTAAEILSQLSDGDTLMLAEGDYRLEAPSTEEGPSQPVNVHFNIVGIGRPAKTRLYGPLMSDSALPISFSNVTFVGSNDAPGLRLLDCAAMTVANVEFDSPRGAEHYALLVQNSRLYLRDCRVFANHNDPVRGAVLATGDSHVEASNSGLGWLRAEDGARVSLGSRCAAFRVWAKGGSAIRSEDSLRLADNTCNEFHFGAEDGGVLHLGQVATRARLLTGMAANSKISITNVSLPDDGSIEVTTEGDAKVNIDGAPVTLIERGGVTVVEDAPPPTAEVLPTEEVVADIATGSGEPASVPTAAVEDSPQVVFCPAANAHDLSTAVFQALKEGDTLVLPEGEYFLSPTQRGSTAVWFNIVGIGRPGHVILRGRIEVFGASPVTISNVEIRGNLTRLALGEFPEPPLHLVGVSVTGA